MTLPDTSDAARAILGTVGAAMQHSREARGLSRAQLARDLGVSDVTLLELEHGRGNPTIQRLTRYAAAYGIDLTIAAAAHPQE